MKPSAEKPLVSPKAIIFCCSVLHIVDRVLNLEYVEVTEKKVFFAGLQLSQILGLVISYKMSKPQNASRKTSNFINIFQTWKPKFNLTGSSCDGTEHFLFLRILAYLKKSVCLLGCFLLKF